MMHFPLQSAFPQIAALVILTSLLFGCASTKEAERRLAEIYSQNQLLRNTNEQLTVKLAEQKTATARLQMELVERQVEIGKAKAVQEAPPSEPEHIRGRMPPPNSKAEAVTCLAEIETEINAAKKPATANEDPKAFSRTDGLLTQSKSALARDSYDEACSLAYQALAAIREIRLKTLLSTRVRTSTYADFIEPLQLQAVKRCNIRKRPSTKSKVLETLAADSTITAVGYRGNWIKVTTDRGQTGWIYYTMLNVPVSGGHGKQPLIKAKSPFLSTN